MVEYNLKYHVGFLNIKYFYLEVCYKKTHTVLNFELFFVTTQKGATPTRYNETSIRD